MIHRIERMTKKPMTKPDKQKNISMAEINFRKRKLKDDLDKLESGFQDRMKKVTNFLPGNLHPSDAIRKHPFRSFGIAVTAGLVFGLSSRRNRSRPDDHGGHSASSSHRGFSSLLMDELKRLAAHRAAYYVSDMIDQKIKKNR